ncbi:uncharacterized protein LOC101211971 [Cucumis sativus]|uniref:Uncharacterized protein n=1 Tax=Cucumis sativus TaxID=3659 RepID=A0A0A0LAB4_CUCSA|nr:uncharacterized protein LOC101211971 [Cucumis sativus]KGN58925.1 hypothetical protein Csa_002393 [Cucumis sativus]
MLVGTIIAPRSFFSRNKQKSPSSLSSSSSSSPVIPLCSGRRPKDPRKDDDNDDQTRDKLSTDWDKAWSKFKKRGKKTMFSDFSPNKYVSWNPRRSEYPLSEEVDPIKRTERSNLMLWTSPRFTLAGAIVIITFLLVYTILAPINK